MGDITLFNRDMSLFERVCSEDSLRDAFRSVKRNKGAAGIDGVSVKDFEGNLDEELGQLQKELLSWTYEPRPVVKTARIGSMSRNG